MTSSFYNSVNKMLRPKRLNNIVDSSYFIRSVRKFAGASVLTIKSNSDGFIVTKFSTFGFISFLFWYSLYFYCFYKIHEGDQTILRTLYNTKLKSYGDEVERITNAMFVVYAMWKIPFDLSGSTEDMQLIVDIDNAVNELGEKVDYIRNLHSIIIICILQISISGTRIFSVWMSLINLGKNMPLAKVFQTIFTDALAFIITTQYCTYLLILRRRYRILNKVLNTMKTNPVSEIIVFPFNQTKVLGKQILVQEKSLSKKIKMCGKIYSMIYKASETANEKYGFVLLLTMLMALSQIILYTYYFMEATAAGLFHEVQNYVAFLIYDFWQIGYAVTIITVFIYFSTAAVKEAQATANIAHEIINSDVDSTIKGEAVNLSLQILHQTPTFTAHGLYKLDYEMLLEGARSVTTFLVILLQFVTDKRSN